MNGSDFVGRPSDAERLARYDEIVGNSLAWRADAPPDAIPHDADAFEFARRVAHRFGKHVVDGTILRQLRAIYDDRPRGAEGDTPTENHSPSGVSRQEKETR